MMKYIKREGIPILSVLLVSAFPAVFLYFQNAEEAGFGEAAPIILAFCAFGAVLYLLCRIIARSPAKGAVAAALFAAIFTNFALMEKGLKLIFPGLKYWHTVPIILVIGLHIAYAAWRFIPDDISLDIVGVVCAVFGALILINGITNAPKITRRMEAENELKSAAQADQTLSGERTGKPNIYLFLFDEYANFPQMEQQYHYDNKPLKDFLEENHFSVSYTSHNESIQTNIVVTNLVNLEYIVDNKTVRSEKDIARKSGALFSLMREQDYEVQIIDYSGFLTDDSPVKKGTSKAAAMTITGENLTDLLIQQTIIYPFHNISTADALADIQSLVDYMSDPGVVSEGDTFTMIYLCFPHTPFIVDENGHEILVSHAADWDDPRYYLGQHQYATKLMIQMVENIIKHDRDAVILLQSDHGARGKGGNEYPWDLMSSPLNAVYYQGIASLDIEGMSTLNTTRLVLNQLLGTDFDILEVPNYSAILKEEE